MRGLLRSPRARAAEDAARADAALRAVGLAPDDLPKGSRTAVRDLSRAQELRLSVALALLGRPGRPEVIAVDDADLGLSGSEREEVAAMLSALAADGTTVLASFREAPRGADLVVPVGEPAAPEDLPPAPGRLRRLIRRGAPAPAAPDTASGTPEGPGGGTTPRPVSPDAAEDAPVPGKAADVPESEDARESVKAADVPVPVKAADVPVPAKAADEVPGQDPQKAVEAPIAEEDADAHPATGRA
ncbi:hypothetical protein [Streptomyces sp. NPDC056600]|uniref:ATP-binding cassette domain-containing protein n=1 Tax=Streptomyces sp. NPDC056600 TaxID=3345874 RepID=UPI0036A4085D